MSIDREERLIVAVCDCCGLRRALDLAPDATDEEISEELAMAGWQQLKPERHRFAGYGIGKAKTVIYPQDFCFDCDPDEPRSIPINSRLRLRSAKVADAFANDPCDEWPRAKVWEMLNLRADCGHPRAATWGTCGYCEAGYPIGHMRRLA